MYPQVGLLKLGQVNKAELRCAKHSLALESQKRLRGYLIRRLGLLSCELSHVCFNTSHLAAYDCILHPRFNGGRRIWLWGSWEWGDKSAHF